MSKNTYCSTNALLGIGVRIICYDFKTEKVVVAETERSAFGAVNNPPSSGGQQDMEVNAIPEKREEFGLIHKLLIFDAGCPRLGLVCWQSIAPRLAQ